MITCATELKFRKQYIFCNVSYNFQNKNFGWLVFVLEITF